MEPVIRRDSARQFASASSCGGIPASAEILFNVSPGFTVYGIQPAGGLHTDSSAVEVKVMVNVGVRVAVEVGRFVDVAVAVSVTAGDSECWSVGVIMSTLSRVGKESMLGI